MRVLITGIDGFVGSHAAEYLLELGGVEIHGTVLDLRGIQNVSHLQNRIRLHELDITDAQDVSSLFLRVQPDRVIHLAGQAFVPDSLINPMNTFRANIIGGVSVLEAARMQKEHTGTDPTLLVVSTGEVYGRVSTSEPITEDFPISPTNPYAASKASIDLITQQYASSFGVHVLMVRPFNHVGPRQSPLFVCSDFGKQFAEIAAGKRAPSVFVGNVEAQRDFTDVRDVVRAYWMLFDQTLRETIFNVCSGHAVRIRELLTIFEEISGLKVEVVSKEERFRSYDVSRVVGSYNRLRTAVGWQPRIPLRQSLLDVFAFWSAADLHHGQEAAGV